MKWWLKPLRKQERILTRESLTKRDDSMQYLLNTETGSERAIVYFKNDNTEILAEHVSELVATGKYKVIEKED